MAARIETLFLDFDGTLADSLPVMALAYQDFLTSCKIDSLKYPFAIFNGPSLLEIVTTLKQQERLVETTDVLLARYDSLIDARYQTVAAMDGGVALLEKAGSRNCTTVIVTSNTQRRVKHWLAKHCLQEMVTSIIDAAAVCKSKPEPELYWHALQQTSSKPASSLVIEDSPQGILAALRAGLTVYALKNQHNIEVRGAAPYQAVKWINTLYDVEKLL